MALITRFTRLLTADLHALLDRLEEPDVVLQQALREMQQELANREDRIRHYQHENDQLDRQLIDLERSLQALQEQLDVCFESNEIPLARTLLKRRLETERLSEHLTQRRESNARAQLGERNHRDENQRQLDMLTQRAQQWLDITRAPEQFDIARGMDTVVTDADVEIALLRETQLRSRP